MTRSLYALALQGLLAGCTHQHLQLNTTAQIRTMMEIHQKQVLDNLALFIVNPEATPSFAVAGGGTTAINDSVGAGLGLNYTRVLFERWNLTSSASRGMSENWTLASIVDPEKLLLMRCAFQT